MRPHRFLGLVALALPLSGCGNSPAPAAKAAVTPAPAAAAPAAPSMPSATAVAPAPPPKMAATTAATPTAAEPALPQSVKYDPKGRRDPFIAVDLTEGAKGATVAAAKLRGVVRGGRGTLALVDTAEGVGYILKQGDTLADGRLVEIGQDSVVFAIGSKAGTAANRIILRLPE